jgi:hypothetical protein
MWLQLHYSPVGFGNGVVQLWVQLHTAREVICGWKVFGYAYGEAEDILHTCHEADLSIGKRSALLACKESPSKGGYSCKCSFSLYRIYKNILVSNIVAVRLQVQLCGQFNYPSNKYYVKCLTHQVLFYVEGPIVNRTVTSPLFRVKWVPCHHGMARPQPEDGDLRIYCHVLGWFVRTVLDCLMRFIVPYTFTHFVTTGNTALSLFCTLSSSPLHTH